MLVIISQFHTADAYGNCGIRLFSMFMPQQIKVKIPKVQTATNTRICYRVCYAIVLNFPIIQGSV
jgi:hypothetical protein